MKTRTPSEVKQRASVIVERFVYSGGPGEKDKKDPEAAASALRNAVSGRVDPMSQAITLELDRRTKSDRAKSLSGLGDWEGWER